MLLTPISPTGRGYANSVQALYLRVERGARRDILEYLPDNLRLLRHKCQRAVPGDGVAVGDGSRLSAIAPCPVESVPRPLPDACPFKLREAAQHLKHEPSLRRYCLKVLGGTPECYAHALQPV